MQDTTDIHTALTKERDDLLEKLRAFKNEIVCDAEELIGGKIGDILMQYHVTRLRCDDVVIEAKIFFASVNVTYSDGLRIKYIKRLGNTYVAKIYLDGEKIKIIPNEDKNLEVKVKTDSGNILLCRGTCGCGAYYATFNNGLSPLKCTESVTAGLGKYNCEIENHHHGDRITFRNSDGVVYLKMTTGNAPMIRINDKVMFNCHTLQLASNPW